MNSTTKGLMAAALIAGGLLLLDVSIEASLLVGFAALIAYLLIDISRHLRKS